MASLFNLFGSKDKGQHKQSVHDAEESVSPNVERPSTSSNKQKAAKQAQNALQAAKAASSKETASTSERHDAKIVMPWEKSDTNSNTDKAKQTGSLLNKAAKQANSPSGNSKAVRPSKKASTKQAKRTARGTKTTNDNNQSTTATSVVKSAKLSSSEPTPVDKAKKDVNQPAKANTTNNDQKQQPKKTSDQRINRDVLNTDNEAILRPLTTKGSQTPQPIIISFIFHGRKVAKDYIFKGKLGDKLKLSSLPPITGYSLNGQKLAHNYSIKTHTQRVTLNVTKQATEYQIIPVTEDLKGIDDKYIKTVKGQPGQPIDFNNFPAVPGYEVYTSRKYKVPTDSSLKVIYHPTEQTVTVLYKTVKGESLASAILNGKTGTSYRVNIRSRHFKGYELAKLPDNLTGRFSTKEQTVILKYQPVKSTIKVRFVDQSGNEVHHSLSFTGHYQERYKISLPTIDGYELATNADLLAGQYGTQTKLITLIFKRSTQHFTIRYWFDDQHKQSAGDGKLVEGLTNDFYKVDSPKRDGYQPSQMVIAGRFSKYAKDNHDINIVYHHIPATIQINFQDEAGRPLPLQSLKQTGYINGKYDFALPTLKGFTRPAQHLIGHYQQKQATRVVHYSANESKVLIHFINVMTHQAIPEYPNETLKGLIGTSYHINAPTIDGYKFKNAVHGLSGVFALKDRTVTLNYQPNASQIVFNHLDINGNRIGKPKVLNGYYGQPYVLKPDTVAGYNFKSSDGELSGIYPTNRQSINLYYRSKTIKFTIVAVNQFHQAIDHQYDIQIQGLVGQQYSHGLPRIPGYSSQHFDIEGTITAAMNGQALQIPYTPLTQTVHVHFICKGGLNSGINPFEDYLLQGPTGDTFDYNVPELPGYKPDQPELKGQYKARPQELTVTYEVQTEHYSIQFVNQQQHQVGGLQAADGTYGDQVQIAKFVPKGFHLPEGSSSTVSLSGKGLYQVTVLPDKIAVELVAKTDHGDDLHQRRQVKGAYLQTKSFHAPVIPGYQPVAGDNIQIKFDLKHDTKVIAYQPEARHIIIQYLDMQGKQLK